MATIHTVIKNYSRYPRDIVWENAQDIEHVSCLHSRTNKSFDLLYAGKESGSRYQYDTLIYKTTRRVYFLTIHTFGFRRILSDYHIQQIEHIPLLGVTSALNSLLRETENSEYPTMLLDEVVMEVPPIMAWFKKYIIKSLQRHTAIQCQEDETFRERRFLLQQKEIKLPFRIFNQSTYSLLCAQFRESISN